MLQNLATDKTKPRRGGEEARQAPDYTQKSLKKISVFCPS
jgi:hypothetical protein